AIVNLVKKNAGADLALVESLVENLRQLRSPDPKYWCWGYSFAWQMRGEMVPNGAPNLVCTSFVANGLLDAYELNGNSQYLEMAVSSAAYFQEQLFWEESKTRLGFSYPIPGMKLQVHNANLLAAALFCRVYKHTGESRLLETAFRVTR